MLDLYFTYMHFTDGSYRLCFNSVIILFFKYIDPLSHNVHLGYLNKLAVNNRIWLSLYSLLVNICIKALMFLNNLFQTDSPYNQRYLLLFSTHNYY